MTSLHSIGPSAWTSGTDWFALSGAITGDGSAFANILASLSPSANATQNGSQSDPLAQLTALVQNGTPISKITDQLSQDVIAALQQKLGASFSQSDFDQIKSSLMQTIAKALAPPGNGPPGTPQQQVAALANRLQRLIEGLAREKTPESGQQNDIAGNILDANSAKEIPARTLANGTASTLDVSSLVSSLLSLVAGQLHELKANPLQARDDRTLGGDPLEMRGGRSLKGDPLQHDTRTLTNETVTQASLPPSPAPAANDASNSSQAHLAPPTPPAITMQNAPDVLARMLVRAAGTDARLNGISALASGANAPQNSTQTPSQIAARLDTLLATLGSNAATSASSSAANNGTQTGGSFDQQFAQQFATPVTHDDGTSSNAIGLPNAVNQTQTPQFAQIASAAAPVDTSALVEQMIKSMVMRTNDQGTSEIRLHLQPENLGDVTMKITVTGNQISANVIASSADVRNTLVSNHHQLARSLADAGLTLSGFSVDVSGGNAGRDRQNNDRTAGFGRRYTVHELPGTQTPELSALASLGPPLLSGSSLALFNYLA